MSARGVVSVVFWVTTLGATAAGATPIQLAFEGQITSGSIGGVELAFGAPLSGLLVYDPDTAPTGTEPFSASYELDPPAGVSIAAEGLLFSTDPAQPEVDATVRAAAYNTVTGELFLFGGSGNQVPDPDDRDTVIFDLLSFGSTSNLPVLGSSYEIQLGLLANPGREPPLDGFPLPDSGEDFFDSGEDFFGFGGVTITALDGSDLEVRSSIDRVTQVPEPSSLALLLWGCALAGLRRRRAYPPAAAAD